MAYIELSGISKAFAGVQALRDINMQIEEGEIYGLAGENGGGKSTLIKILSGFYTPDEGMIRIDEKEYPKGLTPKKAIEEGIQVIYQDFSLFFNLTVAENIALPLEYSNKKKLYSKKNIYRLAREALKRLDVNIPPDALVGELSVANKQLVAIARGVIHNARLLIMDEPTSALTQKEVNNLLEVIKRLSGKGVAVIFVSHKIEEVLSIVKKVMILRNGRKVIEGPIEDFDMEKITYHMTGRKLENTQYICETDNRKGQPLMKVENLGVKNLLRGISFELYSGEIIGVVGLIGSGRSELACALAGLIPITEGSVWVEGKQIEVHSVQEAITNSIAYLPEDRLNEGLFLPQPININIACPILNRFTKMVTLDYKAINQHADDWISELRILTPSHDMPAEMLSGGNQQKVVLAKWLATKPKILILNSPTAGIDVGSKYDIHMHIRRLAKEGMGVLLISDEISEVLNTCNRVLVMKRGLLWAQHETSELDRNKLADEVSEIA